MAFGPGRSGKSTLLRWVIERGHERASGGEMALATVDVRRPTLKGYFSSTMMPKSAKSAMAWLERLLSRLIETKRSGAIDFGADTSLVPLLTQIPDLQRAMTDNGVEPVALYLLTPRQGDLTVLKAMENSGFRPTATALVLNMGTTTSGDAEAEFAALRRHSVYKAAIERGAVEVWMPRLYAAQAVEARQISFRQATASDSGLALFDRSRVFQWLSSMDSAFSAIESWLV